MDPEQAAKQAPVWMLRAGRSRLQGRSLCRVQFPSPGSLPLPLPHSPLLGPSANRRQLSVCTEPYTQPVTSSSPACSVPLLQGPGARPEVPR